MPPRVTYWTGTWDPSKEAISKEVALLRRQSPVVAFSPSNQTRVRVADRVITLSSRHWLAYRMVAACVEPMGDISHVFGSLAAWHSLTALRRRPIILTVVTEGESMEPRFYRNVHSFVAESPALVRSLLRAGIPEARVRLIYPGVNLQDFDVTPSPAAIPFRILFASWPEHPAGLVGRGVTTLVELARRCPDVEVVLLRRPWGELAETTAALDALGLPDNVRVEDLGDRSMRVMYAGVHASAALFAAGFGKSIPNSLVESMASGRPVLVTDECGLAEPVKRAGAGICVGPDVDSVVAGVARLRCVWQDAALAARRLAEETFSDVAFISKYEALYAEIGSAAYAPRHAVAARDGHAAKGEDVPAVH